LTPPLPGGSAHRPDMDGLRAVAVLGVILFHVDPRWLPGGFVGVDVFYVISGYLITGIVARELGEGRFSFRSFYERRIRRILPALWALLIVCVPISWLLMLPADAEAMGKSALWATLAMANVYFWREVSTDYFAPESAQWPFLHLWSLGVEEQFYVIWPAVLVAVWRLAPRERARSIACGLALCSVLASTLLAEALLAKQQARFAYYMLPPRAGELALGAALALGRMPAGNRACTAARTTAALGWGLLACSFSMLSENDPFPGWRSLLPTLGTAALILSGQLAPGGAWIAPLRWGPAQWLGRCSYSAYLWHWPVIAWWHYLWGQPGTIAGLALMSATMLLADASRRWVEDPARLSRRPWPSAAWRHGLVPALLVATLALLVARGDRWHLPLYPDAQREAWAALAPYTLPAHRLEWVCQQQSLEPARLTDPRCELGSGNAPARILLLGDSQAAQFAPLFRIAAEEQGVRVRSIALGSCAPLAGPLKGVVADGRLAACSYGVPLMLQRARDFPLLILGAAWGAYAQSEPAVWTRLETQLRDFTAEGHQVWLLPRIPELVAYDAACPLKRARVGDWLRCPAALETSGAASDTNTRLGALAERIPNVRLLSLPTTCTDRQCTVADADGHYLYADSSHLSAHGSRNLAAELIRTNAMPRLAP
jgi:peptidoglycan/LPS O-acetylase OafA/YrhL